VDAANRSCVRGALLGETDGLGQGLRGARIEILLRHASIEGVEVHLDGSEALSNAIVQFASNASPLLVLKFHQAPAKAAQGFLGSTAVGNIEKDTADG